MRPPLAVLREQGVNGQVELAAAFDRAGFAATDVHMSDVIAGRVSLAGFKGFVAPGGFSYGDVLGGGEGWAKSILFNPRARDEFAAFFARKDSFALGVCNGCQMMSALHELIPGAEAWPRFVKNRSEQFEARLVLVEIPESPSLFFAGMAGSRIPVVTAHGEGRALFTRGHAPEDAIVCMRYVDNRGRATESYPYNVNGSPLGITGVTTADGRFTAFMPHPERVFRSVQMSWHPEEVGRRQPLDAPVQERPGVGRGRLRRSLTAGSPARASGSLAAPPPGARLAQEHARQRPQRPRGAACAPLGDERGRQDVGPADRLVE